MPDVLIDRDCPGSLAIVGTATNERALAVAIVVIIRRVIALLLVRQSEPARSGDLAEGLRSSAMTSFYARDAAPVMR